MSSSFPYTDRLEKQEQMEQQPRVDYPDPLSLAIGATVFMRNHRVEETVRGLAGTQHRIVFSRFYWTTVPRVALDYKREAGDAFLVRAKRAWCEARSIRYVVVEDEFDVSPFLPAEPEPQATAPVRARPGKALRPRRTP